MKKTRYFSRVFQVRFHEADPAGLVYFANILSLAHDTFEEFIEDAGVPWKEWFRVGPYFIPIRHTECDYFSPFYPGQKYKIKASVSRLGETSFQMHYEFLGIGSSSKQIHAVVKMVHAFVSVRSQQKTKIPTRYQKALQPYVHHK